MYVLVNIDVPEIKPAVTFYCSALGLVLNRMVSEDVAELGGAGTTIYLLCNSEATVASSRGPQRRSYARHWTPLHLDFVVNDLEQAAARAQAAGAVQESDCVCWNGSKCITFSDPFGHGFCLIEFEHGTYAGSDA